MFLLIVGRFIFLLLFISSFLFLSSFVNTMEYTLHSNNTDICSSVDIRNSEEAFLKLRGCRVVEGHVQILLFDKTDETSYTNISFPELTEITEYLLLYRINGLKTLATLFPNLAVIRGKHQFFTYSLVIFEMSSLQEIGLYSLTNIIDGAVRIDKNPSLCYVNTIDWELIVNGGKLADDHFIKSNKMENECPICPGDDGSEDRKCPIARHRSGISSNLAPRAGRHLCWNRYHCQKVCDERCRNMKLTCNENGECCDENCLGGCNGFTSSDCTVCKHRSINTVNGRKCIKSSCPGETYQYLFRCVTKTECINMKSTINSDGGDGEKKHYKVHNMSCVEDCPADYYDYKWPNGSHTCEPCQGTCQKDCTGASIENVSELKNMKGCTRIVGSLEIQIRGGRNVVKELEENLNKIEEIDGYLKIVRSFPLISLNFLKNLKVIRGNKLDNKHYVFSVLDNPNLQELWDWDNRKNNTLKILNGRLFFHFNPKLCLHKIEKLRSITGMDKFTDLEVASNSNGDKVACNVTLLNVTVSKTRSAAVILTWQPFVMDDTRSLLGYVVYSIEAPTKNVTLYNGRDGCGGDGWRVDDVTNPSTKDAIYHVLTQLQPYTQYAYYVRTYTIATEKSGAQSGIHYFRTNPDEPSAPLHLSAHSSSSNELEIKWDPPSKPNGKIIHYNVNATCTPDNQEYLQLRDYCKEPLTFLPEEKKPEYDKPEESTRKTSNDPCECEMNDNKKTLDSEKERVSQINFEDELHNRVYIKATKSLRRKREISDNIKKAKARYTTKLNPLTHASESFETRHANSPHTASTTNGSCTVKELFIRACRETEKDDNVDQVCSTASIITARTLKADYVDNVSRVQVSVPITNQTSNIVRLMWDEPEEPNGIILTYQIEYRRVDIENIKSTIECVTRQEFLDKRREYILKDLPAGNYSVRLKATSLAGSGVFSPHSYFFIEEMKSPAINTGLIIGILIIIPFCIAGILFLIYMRRKMAPNVPNMKLIASVNPDYVSTVYVPDDWEVPRKKIELLRELGQGSFGMVYEGIARDVMKGKSEIRCAIKTVNEHATDRERIEFLNEASVMKAFDTTHVVRLLGVVSQGQPTLVVMELMANGDLKSYLRSHRPDAETYNPAVSRQPPTLKRILQMAIEIADGMAYLSAKKFVHRDLAARNCMVAEDLTVKIGDFGMTRDIYETDYYRKGTKGLLPVRWMAPESLKDGVFTSNSDVWSYGVVLWEMATLASQPYQGLSNDQVLRYVIDGGVMERPENCPDKLYNLMRICWQHKPSLRPSFLSLATVLLDDASTAFKQVSFYHSTAGIEARTAIHNSSSTTTSQDDPSTPLRLNKEIEDFSLGSDSEPEDLVDADVDSDFDDKHVSINFPTFQVASFKDETEQQRMHSLTSRKNDANVHSDSTVDLLNVPNTTMTVNGYVGSQIAPNNSINVKKTMQC